MSRWEELLRQLSYAIQLPGPCVWRGYKGLCPDRGHSLARVWTHVMECQDTSGSEWEMLKWKSDRRPYGEREEETRTNVPFSLFSVKYVIYKVRLTRSWGREREWERDVGVVVAGGVEVDSIEIFFVQKAWLKCYRRMDMSCWGLEFLWAKM